MKRIDGRKNNELRKIKVTKNYIKHPAGSCLIEFGETRVICTATVEESVPPFLRNAGKGWVTAEYGMLPGSCNSRIRRNNVSGRSQEIQRLIGRSLRNVVNTEQLGERTIKIDCDVIQADGGTRTASVTGGFIALALALKDLKKKSVLDVIPLNNYVAAISVGTSGNDLLLDLNYEEDSTADMDMNIVMLGNGKFVEIQGTAEGAPFSKKQMNDLVDIAKKGISELIVIQKKVLGQLKF
ncbi:MAG: ribonuclease PH [Candidatus Zapsychrus exili]|nr:ribonuclease PH [Candidatus Zapsychrus exili]